MNQKNNFKKRRKHSNSKYGCLECKKRRIKCGQELPECKNCTNYRAKTLKCSYNSLTEAQKAVIREANKKLGLSVSPKSGNVEEYESDERDAFNGKQYSSTPPNTVANALPMAQVTNKSFELLNFHSNLDNESLCAESMSFITSNLRMPIMTSFYTKHIAVCVELWSLCTIESANDRTITSFYALMAWSSSFLAGCSSKVPPWLESVALKNNQYSLQNLSQALGQKNYSLMLDLMSSNVYITYACLKEEDFISKMTHLNGLVAILYEIYLHTRSAYYPGTRGYTDIPVPSNQSPEDTAELCGVNGDQLLVPGYSRFQTFSSRDSLLIKVFEWHVYLSAVAVFIPPYSHECLYEFHDSVLEFRNTILYSLSSTDPILPRLHKYTENMLGFLDFLNEEILPKLVNRMENDSLLVFSPKKYHEIYTRYQKIVPSEAYVAIFKDAQLSVVEKTLYRYFILLGKLLDQVLPELRYLFIFGLLTTHIVYVDHVTVFDDFLIRGDCSDLLPPNCHMIDSSQYTDLVAKLRSHVVYCSRVFTFFRSRNILTHNGVLIRNPYNDYVRENPFKTRMMQFKEVHIKSFKKTFIAPWHFPHKIEIEIPDNKLDAEYDGYSLKELFELSVKPDQDMDTLNSTNPQELIDLGKCPIDTSGHLLGYDFVLKSIQVHVVLRNLVGKSLKDLYNDRVQVVEHFNNL